MSGRILTFREWEVLDLVRQGYKNREIAVQLGVGEGAVIQHLVRINVKLGVHKRKDAVQEYQKRGGFGEDGIL